MKNVNQLVGIAIVAILFSACDKENVKPDKDYLTDIVGSYSGEFSNQLDANLSNPGIADVMIVNDQLQIHCYGDLMDTIFVMDAFENGDSIMICATGETFEHEYGHMGNGGNHMMDTHNSESEWEHHMIDDHTGGDMHYGGFDMQMHTFEYKFRMMEGDSVYHIMFNGSKN